MAIGTSFGFNPGISTINNKEKLMSSVADTSKQQTLQKSNIQTPVPQKPMMSYNVKVKDPSEKYPMLEKKEEEDIDKQLNSIEGDDIDKRLAKEELYKRVVTAKQSKAFLDDRERVRGKILTNTTQDKEQNNKLYKQSQFADVIRNIALSKGADNIFEVNDNDIINKTITSNENMNKLYNEFIMGDMDSLELKDKITGTKRFGKGNVKFANFLRESAYKLGWTEKRALTEEEWNKLKTEGRIKGYGETLTKDFGGAPSVIVGGLTVPAKMISGGTKLLGKAFGKDWGFNDSIDKLVEKSGIQKDLWFDMGKMATEIGISAMAINGALANIGKVGELANFVKVNPSIQKYMAKPLLKLVSGAAKTTTEGLGYQATADLQKGELSSKKDYLTSAAFNLGFNALGKVVGAVKGKILPPKKILKNAVQSVDEKLFNKMVADTKAMKGDINAPHVYDNITNKIDDALNSIIEEKGSVGSKIGEYRNQLDNISLGDTISRQSLIDDFVSSLETKANTTVKIPAKGVPKITNFGARTSAGSIEGADKTLIKDTLTLVKQAQKGMKASSLESLQTNLKGLIKTSNATSTTKNAISEYVTKLGEKLNMVAKDSGLSKAKQEYSRLIGLQEEAKRLASEGGNKAINAIRKITSVGEGIETKKLINELTDMGLIKGDLVKEAYTANYIMSQILDPQEFQKALATIDPSVPGVIEAGIRGVKQLVSPNTLSRIARNTKGYNKYNKRQTLLKSGIKRQATNKNKTE